MGGLFYFMSLEGVSSLSFSALTRNDADGPA